MNEAKPVGGERHWVDHVEVLRRRWRIVLATFLGFVVVAAAVTLREPPVYRATARIVIGDGLAKSPLSDRMSAIEGYLVEQRSFETQIEVIRSEPVALRAAERLGWLPEKASADRRVAAAARVKSAVDVEHLRDTRIVLIHGFGRDADTARNVANAVAKAYIAYTEEEETQARRRSIDWLRGEIDDLRGKVRQSEERLVDYLSHAQIDLGSEGASSPLAATPADDTLQSQIASAEVKVSQLLRRYRKHHPKVIEARARLASLERRLAEERTQHAGEQRKLIQYRLLKRDADLDREMYQVLLKKLKEADLSAGFSDDEVRVLEAAIRPSVPIGPRTARNLAVAAVLGLCAALGLAFAVESLDRSIGSPEDVTRLLGLPTLGVVGEFARQGGASALVATLSGSLEAETFRALRTNVRFSHVDRPRRVMLVTSTGPEEGKSTILANLAVSLAQSGRRTLVVDTDLRRPTLHRLFGLRRSTGLADLLAGDATRDQALGATALDGLFVLPCGTLPANPAELIESERLQGLLAELREEFDYVLLDSPPAGGLIDASLLSALCDGVLFVVEPRRFDARLLVRAVRQLQRAGARLYGVVLNKAPREEQAGLYRYYAYGSGAEERPDAVAEGSCA